jgi:hypothetical protein
MFDAIFLEVLTQERGLETQKMRMLRGSKISQVSFHLSHYMKGYLMSCGVVNSDMNPSTQSFPWSSMIRKYGSCMLQV